MLLPARDFPYFVPFVFLLKKALHSFPGVLGKEGRAPPGLLEDEWSYLLDSPGTVAPIAVGAAEGGPSNNLAPASPTTGGVLEPSAEVDRTQQSYLAPNASEKDLALGEPGLFALRKDAFGDRPIIDHRPANEAAPVLHRAQASIGRIYPSATVNVEGG